MTHSTRIASLHLLESGNLDVQNHLNWYEADELVLLRRLHAIEQLWNDKRLTDLLDAFIAADNGEQPLQ